MLCPIWGFRSSGGHPRIPDLFVWRDEASDSEVVFAFDHGYGGGTHILPNGHALYCAWNTDVRREGLLLPSFGSPELSLSLVHPPPPPPAAVALSLSSIIIISGDRPATVPADACICAVAPSQNGHQTNLHPCPPLPWQRQNGGPQTPEAATKQFAALRKKYPNAKVFASTFDDFSAIAHTVKDRLPVVTSEIGDTWLYGVPSVFLRPGSSSAAAAAVHRTAHPARALLPAVNDSSFRWSLCYPPTRRPCLAHP